jgi:hypothetical protein
MLVLSENDAVPFTHDIGTIMSYFEFEFWRIVEKKGKKWVGSGRKVHPCFVEFLTDSIPLLPSPSENSRFESPESGWKREWRSRLPSSLHSTTPADPNLPPLPLPISLIRKACGEEGRKSTRNEESSTSYIGIGLQCKERKSSNSFQSRMEWKWSTKETVKGE